MKLTCQYCGLEGEWNLDIGPGEKCLDVNACIAREERQHAAEVRRLKKLRRIGEELTEAEKQVLADAT